MRDAMKVADEAGIFDRIVFDPISARSENRTRSYLDSLSAGNPSYVPPSQNIMQVRSELEVLHDYRETSKALDKIE